MARALKTWAKAGAVLQDLFRRHWQRALIIRDSFRLNQEAVNLLLAGIVGVLAGLANWAYFICNNICIAHYNLLCRFFCNTGKCFARCICHRILNIFCKAICE